MRWSRNPSAVGIALALSVIMVAACTPQQETQGDAEAQLCTSLTAFGDSLQALEDLDPATASVEDVQAARADIQAAWDQVRDDAANVEQADDAAVDAAWSEVAQAIDDFPTDAPIEEALTGVQASAQSVRSAFEEMSNGLGCA